MTMTYQQQFVLDGLAGRAAILNLDARHNRLYSTGDLVGWISTFRHAGATFTRAENELMITPAHAITSGQEFTTVVAYTGTPTPRNTSIKTLNSDSTKSCLLGRTWKSSRAKPSVRKSASTVSWLRSVAITKPWMMRLRICPSVARGSLAST